MAPAPTTSTRWLCPLPLALVLAVRLLLEVHGRVLRVVRVTETPELVREFT